MCEIQESSRPQSATQTQAHTATETGTRHTKGMVGTCKVRESSQPHGQRTTHKRMHRHMHKKMPPAGIEPATPGTRIRDPSSGPPIPSNSTATRSLVPIGALYPKSDRQKLDAQFGRDARSSCLFGPCVSAATSRWLFVRKKVVGWRGARALFPHG